MARRSKYDYPYTEAGKGKLGNLFRNIRESAIPDKVDTNWLRRWPEFRAAHDHLLVSLLEFLNLIDASGVPTEHWSALKKDRLPSKVLGHLMRASYKSIFDQLGKKACDKDTPYLVEYFMGTGASKNMARKMAATFKALCALSEFDDTKSDDSAKTHTAEASPAKERRGPAAEPTQQSITVHNALKSQSCVELHIDFQIHITPDLEEKQIEKIFESIAKYILKSAVNDG